MPKSTGEDLVTCTFCGKSQKEVKKLIAGPGVYICDECIELCNEIIEEEVATGPQVAEEGEITIARRELVEIMRTLDKAGGALEPVNERLSKETDRLSGRLYNLLTAPPATPPED